MHLATIIYAVRGGPQRAAEILERTRGNVAWAAFYAVFVFAAAVHAAIGLRTILAEWLGWRGEPAEFAMTVFAFILTVLGLRAVVGGVRMRASRNHPAYWAFLVHRLSGVGARGSSCPLHFYALGTALEGEARAGRVPAPGASSRW